MSADPDARALRHALVDQLSEESGSWYHGTADRDFEVFDADHVDGAPRGGGSAAGVFFTNSHTQADNFRRLALKYDTDARDKNDGRVIEAEITGRFKTVDVPKLEAERARASRMPLSYAKPSMLGRQREWMLDETERALSEGYDGVDFVNILDDPLSAKNRATHRVVFPHKLDAVSIKRSHVLPPAGVLETPIGAPKGAAKPPAAPRAKPPAKYRPYKVGRF